VIRLGTEGAYAPYNYVDDAGKLAGFEIELGDALRECADPTRQWVQNEWDSITSPTSYPATTMQSLPP
jgi:polar amino acid transport system substrate-binding protein